MPDISPVDLRYVSQPHFFTKVWITTLCTFCDVIKITYSCYYLLLALLFFSRAKSCLTLCDPMEAACQASLSFPVSRSLLKLMSFESVMPSNHLILCCTLLLPSIFPSIRVFSNESALCIRWPKYWSFSISPSNEYFGWLTGLISLQYKGLSRVFSSTTVWRHQFFGTQTFLLSSSYICTWLLEKS